MNNTIQYKGYVGSVEFSEEDGVFYGKVMGIRSLISYEGENAKELLDDFHGAIDDYLESPEKYQANMDWFRADIAKCTYRQFSSGFYFGKPSEETQIYDNNTYVNEYIYLGIVESIDERGFARVEKRN